MMLSWFILMIAVLTGLIMPTQAGINASLGKELNSTLHAAFVSFVGGFLAITIACLVTREYFPSVKQLLGVPPHLLAGGLLGCVFVVVSIMIAPKLGATLYVSSVVAGQLIGSILLDHFGWLGFEVHPISWMRLVGVSFLFAGVFLIRLF